MKAIITIRGSGNRGKTTLLCIYDGNVLIKEIELFDIDPKLISIPTKKKIKLFKGKK